MREPIAAWIKQEDTPAYDISEKPTTVSDLRVTRQKALRAESKRLRKTPMRLGWGSTGFILYAESVNLLWNNSYIRPVPQVMRSNYPHAAVFRMRVYRRMPQILLLHSQLYLPVAGSIPSNFLLHPQLHLLVACAPTFSSIPKSIFCVKVCSCFSLFVSLPTV